MKQTKYEKLHQRYIQRMASLKDSQEVADIAEDLENGRTHVLKMKRLETSSFDTSWIKEIEDCIYDLGNIVKVPKITTKTTGDVIPVELARKIGSESVIHLASHTNYVKEVNERGEVVPSKILNIGSDDQFATYENRFIATLIRRLMLFTAKRYEYAAEFAEIYNADVMYIKNKSIVDGMDVEIETKIKITQPIEANKQQARDYLNRIEEVRNYISFYYNSDFMKKLKNEADVRTPIVQTNIIRKNPEYNHCYRLFKFLESYDGIGMTHKVSETYSSFSDDDIDEVNTTILANFLTVKSEQPSQIIKKSVKEGKLKVLTSMDDEMFEFGPLNKGPIHYVRIDDEYMTNMSARNRVPEHLNNNEKVYYEDEINENHEKAEDLEELKKLIRRKKEELKYWEKRVQSTIAKREWDAEVARRKEELRILREREARLKAARKKLVESALNNEDVLAEKKRLAEEREAKRIQKLEEAAALRAQKHAAEAAARAAKEAEEAANPKVKKKPAKKTKKAKKEKKKKAPVA